MGEAITNITFKLMNENQKTLLHKSEELIFSPSASTIGLNGRFSAQLCIKNKTIRDVVLMYLEFHKEDQGKRDSKLFYCLIYSREELCHK